MALSSHSRTEIATGTSIPSDTGHWSAASCIFFRIEGSSSCSPVHSILIIRFLCRFFSGCCIFGCRCRPGGRFRCLNGFFHRGSRCCLFRTSCCRLRLCLRHRNILNRAVRVHIMADGRIFNPLMVHTPQDSGKCLTDIINIRKGRIPENALQISSISERDSGLSLS